MRRLPRPPKRWVRWRRGGASGRFHWQSQGGLSGRLRCRHFLPGRRAWRRKAGGTPAPRNCAPPLRLESRLAGRPGWPISWLEIRSYVDYNQLEMIDRSFQRRSKLAAIFFVTPDTTTSYADQRKLRFLQSALNYLRRRPVREDNRNSFYFNRLRRVPFLLDCPKSSSCHPN